PPREGRRVIAYFHGNGGNIAYRADRLMRFARDGFGVLMPEYRGYGGNPGTPSEAGLFADGHASLDFLRGEGIAGKRLVLYGESLGSAVAVEMAATVQIGALVLESPFTSIAAVAQHHYPFVPAKLLVLDRFDALSRIGQVRAPLLVLQGGRDPVVPPHFGDALFAAAMEPKERWFAPEGGHEDLARFGALDAVVDFIARHAR
ncbi:alpha/beta hydrolase, partial [Sphingomonas sp.]|uniref:alpha/beta hydrolase n=1 Tax=Sphingomonas sp. TaxID=28214 RepID=UPI002E3066A6